VSRLCGKTSFGLAESASLTSRGYVGASPKKDPLATSGAGGGYSNSFRAVFAIDTSSTRPVCFGVSKTEQMSVCIGG